MLKSLGVRLRHLPPPGVAQFGRALDLGSRGCTFKSCHSDYIYTITFIDSMEICTVQEWEDDFDNLLDRVEKGEHIGIISEDGTAAVMIPYDDELVRIYTEENNEAQ